MARDPRLRALSDADLHAAFCDAYAALATEEHDEHLAARHMAFMRLSLEVARRQALLARQLRGSRGGAPNGHC